MQNFTSLNLRNDVGDLWRNYLASERIKFQDYNELNVRNYFWRTYDQQELDWVEEQNGLLSGVEFKWNEKKKVKKPVAWTKHYPEATFEAITPGSYLDWIT